MQRWQVGDATITRIVEIETPGPAHWLIPEATPERLLEERWLRPHFARSDGKAIMSVHAFVVEADGMRMIVDTCVGNDKKRGIKGWNMRTGPFLRDLAEAGHRAESIDRVLCTHLHVDHVGWNTRLADGRWVPTFPNARYLFARAELEHWLASETPEVGEVMQDSVRPVLDADLADPVATDHRVSASVCLEPTPGHTPGHASVRISSRGMEAVITGDLMHHPVQCAHPDWGSSADVDSALAERTRRAFLARHADTPTLVFGTHFATPSAGHVVRDGDAFRFVVE